MSEQPGFRQPDSQPTPEPQASDPYAAPQQPAYGQPAQPGYGRPAQPGYAQPYGASPAYPSSAPDAPQYGQYPTEPGQAPYGQGPYGASYGQDPYAQSPAPYGGYGQPAYGYGQLQPEHPQATTVLILAILGFFVPVVPFVAWYMGGQAKKDIEAGAPYQWDGQLKIGYLIGKILSILQIVSVVLMVVWFVFMIGLFATTGY